MKSLVSPKTFFRSLGGSWKEKGSREPQMEIHEEPSVELPESQTGMQARLQRVKTTPPPSPGQPAAGALAGSASEHAETQHSMTQIHQRPLPVKKTQSMPQMPVAYPQDPSSQQRSRKQMIVWPVELVRQKLPTWSPPNLQREMDEAAGIASAPDDEDGWLGIEFQPRTDGHLVITKIVEGGPADGTKSVMVGDIIVGIRGFFARALTPMQIKELTKGFAGTKLALTLGSEFERGHSYTMEHQLIGGGTVQVARVKIVNLKPSQPVCMEPEQGLNLLSAESGDDSVSVVAEDADVSGEMWTAEDLEQKEISEAMTTSVSMADDCTEDGESSVNGETPRKNAESPKQPAEAPHPTPVKAAGAPDAEA